MLKSRNAEGALFLAPQLVDSTHSTFVRFNAQKQMLLGGLNKSFRSQRLLEMAERQAELDGTTYASPEGRPYSYTRSPGLCRLSEWLDARRCSWKHEAMRDSGR